MKTAYQWIGFLLIALLLGGCDEQGIADINDFMPTNDSVSTENIGDGLEINDIKFSKDYKTIEVTARLLHDVGAYDLTDSASVRVTPLQQVKLLSGRLFDETQPQVVKVTNVSREQIAKIGIRLLVLVDLSLPQELIDEERTAVLSMRNLIGSNALCLAFMSGDNVTETYEATDYIINNYFTHRDPSYTYLYRSMLTKLAEYQDPSKALGSSRYKVLVIFSGGKTYEGDQPIDPEHFAMQQQLADMTQVLKGKLLAYFCKFSADSQSADGEAAEGDEAALLPDFIPGGSSEADINILQYFCKDLNGVYQNQFSWTEIEDDILEDFNIHYANYLITLEQPDKKVYRGDRHSLRLSFYDRATDDLIVTGSSFFYLGSAYAPVIVEGGSMTDVIIQGTLMAIVVFLLAWLAFQFIEPYIRYRWFFRKKHVHVYGGPNMSFDGQQVSETCYYCKAPFEEGEEIVTKCQHTMHLHCWEENEYHCPEYGRHCKDGSHYYNTHNLYDTRNALFYMKWVLMAIVAGFVSWLFYSLQSHDYSIRVVNQAVLLINDLKEGTHEAELAISEYGSRLTHLPAFGTTASFFLTLFLSYLTVRRRQWVKRIAEMLLRAAIAGALAFLSCVLGCVISIALHFDSGSFLVDWIPWALMSCVIIFAITYKTRIRIQKIYLLAACLVGFLSMLIWGVIYNGSLIDFRVALLMSFITFAVGIAVCIAHVTPHSERYFLHVEGAIKEMDIALYKWMRNSTDHVVTIGKSVDCSIQLSWDLNGTVAPQQAEIRKHVGSMRLTAQEEGVFVDNDKPLPVGQEAWLYHGRHFTIGNTTFTYIEKDN